MKEFSKFYFPIELRIQKSKQFIHLFSLQIDATFSEETWKLGDCDVAGIIFIKHFEWLFNGHTVLDSAFFNFKNEGILPIQLNLQLGLIDSCFSYNIFE